MQDLDSEEARRFLFETDGFFCIYIPEASMRVGVEKGADEMNVIKCFGGGCNGGKPCRDDCPYYVEITIRSFNE